MGGQTDGMDRRTLGSQRWEGEGWGEDTEGSECNGGGATRGHDGMGWGTDRGTQSHGVEDRQTGRMAWGGGQTEGRDGMGEGQTDGHGAMGWGTDRRTLGT